MRSKGLLAFTLAATLALLLSGDAFGAIIRVKWDSPTDGPGTSWDNAYHTVTAGLAAASAGDEVWVARGTYSENLSMWDRALYGGFAGTETSREQRDFRANVTIIDGRQGGRVIDCGGTSTARIDGFTIRNGKAPTNQNGGGIYCSSSCVVANNIITCNTAGQKYGGGIYGSGTSIVVCNNFITANSANLGGGIYFDSGTPTVANNTVVANYADRGGGIFTSNASPTVTNNIIAHNSSGIRTDFGAPVLRSNCFYNPDGYDYWGVTAGTGDILSDPMLVSPCFAEVHIQPSSPCIDAGYDGAVQLGWRDIDCQARTSGSHVDIGADECDGITRTFAPTVVRVSPTGDDANDGSTWALAKKTVQAGANGLVDKGGEVWVAGGIYPERISLPNLAFVYGGFAGTESTRAERDWHTNETTLDGGAAGSVVIARQTAHETNGIDGFTIRNGKADTGGGIYCYFAAPVITNNLITGNTAGNTGNAAQNGGGGIGAWCSTALIMGNTITGNSSLTDGGGLMLYYHGSSVSANTISDNSAVRSGGAMYCSNGRSVVQGNTLADNHADKGGAVASYACWSQGLVLNGNTIAGNTAVTEGGAIRCEVTKMTMMNNCILSNAVAAANAAAVYCYRCDCSVSGNTISSNTGSGFQLSDYSLTMTRNLVSANTGYGIQFSSSLSTPAQIQDNILRENGRQGVLASGHANVVGNIVAGNAGGVACTGYPVIISNNTIVGNVRSLAAALSAYNSAAIMSNNVVALNSNGVYGWGTPLPTLHGNCVFNPGGYNYSAVSPGVGDISVDPKFVSVAGGDYHLKVGSPCIDAGWADAAGIPALDMDGEARVNGAVDIGADEYWLGPIRLIPDTRTAVDTAPVSIYGGIVSAVFGDQFYVESGDRIAGVLVKKQGHTLRKGDRAQVVGQMATDEHSERFIDAASADATGVGLVAPLAVTNRGIGNGVCWGWLWKPDDYGRIVRVWEKVPGLSNIGILVSTSGKVTGIETTNPPLLPTWFTIDDGSGIHLKCTVPSNVTIDTNWQNVRVTGIASCERVGSEIQAVLKVRGAEDVLPF